MNKHVFRKPTDSISKYLSALILGGGSFFISYVLYQDLKKSIYLAVALGGGIFLLLLLSGYSHFELTEDGVLTYFRNKKPKVSYKLQECEVYVQYKDAWKSGEDKNGKRRTQYEKRYFLYVRQADKTQPDEYMLNKYYAGRLRDALKPYYN